MSPAAIATWEPDGAGTRGAQRKYSDLAIESALTLRGVPRRAGLHLFIDSTGLSTVGEGEWAAAKYGGRGTRGWKKLHVGVDQAGVTVVVPPAKTARVSRRRPRSRARDHTITTVKRIGRQRWKKTARYHQQARVENAFFRYKSIIGDGLRARTPGGRTTEAVLACNMLNAMTAMGRPASYAIGR